ncbi:MAG: alpha-amylase family glycosyl hydrolase, partial [Oscillospiraceae bacterium]
MFFDSLNENYKTPYGAVEKGQIVKFKLILPAVFAQCKPRLVWHFDGQIETEAVLLKGEPTADGDVTFHYEFTADAIGLCYYHFDLYSEYRKIFRGELGKGYMTTEKGTEFQLTIYKKGFETPDEFKGKVMYQIFPDRFYESHPHPKMPFDDRVYRTDKDGEPYFWPNECGGHLNLDFFGGDLQGIIEKMPYLKSLGVTIIYLNPIF